MTVRALRHALVQLTTHETDDAHSRPLSWSLVGRLIQATQPYGHQRNLLLVLVVIRSIQLPALTWLITAIIQGPIAARDTSGVVWGTVAFVGLALSTQLVMHFRQRLALEFGEAVVNDLRRDLFQHIQRMPMSWFQQMRLGRIISRMASDMEDIRLGVQDVLFVSLVQLGQMFVAAACMLWYDAMLFTVVLAITPVIALINHWFHHRLSRALRAMRESYSRVTSTLVESICGIRVTQSYCRERENAQRFRELTIDHSRYNTEVMHTQGLFVPLLELNGTMAMALLLVVGGLRAIHHPELTSMGDLVGFFFMAHLFFAPISVLGNQYHQAMTAMAGAERIFSILDLTPAWSDPIDALPCPAVEGVIELKHVTFGYRPDQPILHDINLRIEAGQRVAIVGATGSGKSSLLQLLAKYYLPDTGEILVDGNDLRKVQTDTWRRQLSLVLQQNFLFQGTIADNIRLGNPTATNEDIGEVIAELDCAELMLNLSHGLDSVVGERGGRLSAGQRQMICFARAMLANPRVLLLDEATSHLDPSTEHRLQGALEHLLEGRTCVIIAHRLSTIRHADQIVVLHAGRIVEQGTYDQLLAANGYFTRLHGANGDFESLDCQPSLVASSAAPPGI